MATTTQDQHACNLTSRSSTIPSPSLFRNDANNVTAIQDARLQKQAAEAAARVQQENLNEVANRLDREIKDRQKEQKELDILREEVDALNETIHSRDNMLAQAKREIDILERDKQQQESLKTKMECELAAAIDKRQQVEDELHTVDKDQAALKIQVESLSAQVNRLEDRSPSSSPEGNCLPFQYHNSTVRIVNLESQRAIDAGKDNGAKAHGWDYDLQNSNQIFTLSKANSDPELGDCWIIKCHHDGKRIFSPCSGTGWELEVGHPGRAPGKADHWYIGRGSHSRVGSWIIKNLEWGTCMQMENNSRKNGTRIFSFNFSDHDTANWVIIPIAFSI